jgi:hypothetical protein
MEPAFEIPVGTGSVNPTDTIVDTHAISESGIGRVLWLYSVEVENVRMGNDYNSYLWEVAVTVRQNVPIERSPVTCRLVRWLALDETTLERTNVSSTP